MTQPVFRFAPSPNGRLHLGHAYSALLNANLAGQVGGRFLLRIEDIDTVRCRPEWVEAAFEDLAWLGLQWEEPVRRQSEHFDEYRSAAAALRGRGLLYPCFCTRRAIAEAVARQERDLCQPVRRDPDGVAHYPGTCRLLERSEVEHRMAAGEPAAWRLDAGQTLKLAPGPHRYLAFDPAGAERLVVADPSRWGDAVLVRKETPTSYHLSVVIDDAVQGVTHVVRGTDLEAATGLHVLLQALLGLSTPAYHHHRLILGTEGEKLSKSLGSETLADARARGATPTSIRAALGFLV